MLAQQPVWQAGIPMPIHVDFDVPVFGAADELDRLREASDAEYSVAQRRAILQRVSAAEPQDLSVTGGHLNVDTSMPQDKGGECTITTT